MSIKKRIPIRVKCATQSKKITKTIVASDSTKKDPPFLTMETYCFSEGGVSKRKSIIRRELFAASEIINIELRSNSRKN